MILLNQIKKIAMKKVKSTFAVIIIFLTLTSFETIDDSADRIIGKWILPDNIKIEIYKKNNKFHGKIIDLRVYSSSGYSMLDKAAIASVKKWLFRPGMRGHDKIEMWVRVPIRFKLN